MNDINPFIRFCDIIHFGYAIENYAIAYDCRIFYVTSGKISIKCCDKTYELNANSLLYIPPNKKYLAKCESSKIADILSINFDINQESNYIKTPLHPDYEDDFDENKITLMPDTEPFTDIIYISNISELKSCFLDIYNEFKLGQKDYGACASGYLKTVLVKLSRMISLNINHMPEILSEVVRYIDHNYMAAITQETIKELFHYHPYYINRLFNKFMSVSMHQYIIRVRISEAKKLISSSDKTIEEIAYKTGFNSASNFSQTFKRQTGTFPSEYRKNPRNLLI